jgi:GNAT superfamily N-acetyltransferase
MSALDEVAAAWARGWAVSRGTAAPVQVPGGLRIDVGLPDHPVRYVIPRYDEAAVRALVELLDQPGTWVKVCAEPVEVAAVLSSSWRISPPQFLMSTPLSARGATDPVSPPDLAGADASPPYRLEVVTSGACVDAGIRTADGRPAARGRAALTGDVAVVDQVETEPDHRRRGLGKQVMEALTDAGVRRGARTGVLVATEDGRALYSALGWSLRSPVTAAVLSA